MSIAVIGGGSWGTALAHHLASHGHPVNLWVFEPEVAQCIQQRHENDRFLPGHRLSPLLKPTPSLKTALKGVRTIVFVVPSHVARPVLEEMKVLLPHPVPFISATKGIENGSLMLPTEVIVDVLGAQWRPLTGALSGPSFAKEVVQGLPTAVTLALPGEEVSWKAQALFTSGSFRIYLNPDVVGVQVGGAVKNVLAIAAGISDGLGFGNNARAALITRGLAEMRRLGQALGGTRETFAGLSGLGDLILTCTGDLSRNRTVGMKLGRGLGLSEITRGMHMVAEGIHTAESVTALSQRHGVEMPICRVTDDILHRGKKPLDAFRELMARQVKDETTDLPRLPSA
jgi:glycerol-3-phosphate dehydrogenase (NAD(P)+)